jgi:hypothetical protein
MSMPDDDGGDLSVQLNWPEDPAVSPAPIFNPEVDESRPAFGEPATHVDARLDALASLDVSGQAPEEIAGRVDYALSEIVSVLRSMNEMIKNATEESMSALDERMTALRTAIMSMLASRQAGDQRAQSALTDALAATRENTDSMAEEIKALRRRITVKGNRGPVVPDDAVDELVQRVADEVEIRIAAALKPKPAAKKRRA